MGLADGRAIIQARTSTPSLQEQANAGTLRILGKAVPTANSNVLTQAEAARRTTQTQPYQQLQKESISQGVVSRGLQTGASGASSGVVLSAEEAARLQALAAQRRAAVAEQTIANRNAGSTVSDAPTSTSGNLGKRVVDDSGLNQNPAADTGISEVQGLNAAEIEAALTALEAKYGLTREQLLADQTEIGATYRFLAANLQKARSAALEGVDQDALARGVLRSGIAVQNRAEVSNDFAQREAQAEQEKAQRLRAINNALASLDTSLASDKAATAQGIGQEQLASKERLADILRLASTGYTARDAASGRTDIDPVTGGSFGLSR